MAPTISIGTHKKMATGDTYGSRPPAMAVPAMGLGAWPKPCRDTPTVVWVPEAPPGPQQLKEFVTVGGPLPPQSKTRYSFILPESREAGVGEFLA
jgi:hypothetical protein